VRLARLAPGFVIPEHRHDGDELLVIVDGIIDCSRTGTTFRTGDVCRSARGTVHEQRVGRGSPCIALIINLGPPVPTTLYGRVLKRLVGI
jgi:anti-sigma factor ChrR (cupin superfamily)